MKPHSYFALLVLAASSLTARAVTFSIDAEILKDRFGAAMQSSGLVILTAATTGSFNGPSGNDFVTGGEMLLYRWDLTGGFGDGILSNATTALSFTGDWDQGDSLRLYWYPDLDINAAGPGEGTYYGYYSDPAPLGTDGSAPWTTPGEADNVSLRFFTTDASFLNDGGSNSAFAGQANAQVPAAGPSPDVSAVPEPGNVFGLSLLLASAMQIRLRSRKRPAAN